MVRIVQKKDQGLGTRDGEIGGMDGVDVCVALEVTGVEGENVLDAVDMHGGDQTGVMDLDATDAVGDQEASPFRVNIRPVCQEAESAFKLRCAQIRLFR